MRLSFLSFTAGFVLSLLAACDHMGGGDGLASQLETARREVARHHRAVLDAKSLGEIRADLAVHQANMDETMAEMESAMADMSHCSDGDRSAMMAGMEGMRGALTEHATRMESAASVEEARALCDEHASAMDEMMRIVETNADDGCCR